MADAPRRSFDDLVPDNAPFDEEQRAWLNGFLAGLLGLTERADTPPPGGSRHDGLATPSDSGAPALEERRQLADRERAIVRAEAARSSAASALEVPAATSSPANSGAEGRSLARVLVESRRALSHGEAGVEVSEVIVDLAPSGLTYAVGDSLAILPTNDLDLVRALLRAVGVRGQEVVTTGGGAREVWRCLLEDVDVTHLQRDTIALLASEAKSAREERALCEMLDDASGELDLLDVLEQYPSARPSIERIVATLPPLRPRTFAIASSPSVHPSRAHLLVRTRRSERNARERKGVASTLLGEGVFRGDELSAYVQPGVGMSLPSSDPLIFVASGVGIGRFKGLLEELSHRGREGGTWLIICSCAAGDELVYEKEIGAFRRAGVLEHVDVVPPAPRSRRGGLRDTFKRRGRRLAGWLEAGAHVYVSGELCALSEPPSETISDVLERHARKTRASAREQLESLRRDGRYVEETY